MMREDAAVMKILWLSQHQPLPRQLAALRKRFGNDVEVLQDISPFKNAEEIQRRYKSGGYGDVVVVAPLSVIGRLCDLGLRPLYAEMEQVGKADAELTYRGRHYRFKRFRRVRGVRLEFVEGEDFSDE